MGKTAVVAPNAPKAIGPYSAALRAGQLLFVSGQVPIDPGTGLMVDGDIGAQTRQVLRNITALLEAGGCSIDSVVRTTVFLADMNDYNKLNELYRAKFKGDPPARTCVQVAKLLRDAKVEMEAVAVLK